MIKSLQPLCDLIATHENWLIYRVVEDLRQLEDSKDTLALIEAGQIAIAELSLILIDTIQKTSDLQDPSLYLDYTQKAIGCALKIKRQQEDYQTDHLSFIQKIVEACRQSYLNLLIQENFSQEQIQTFRKFINQVFEGLIIELYQRKWINQLEIDKSYKTLTVHQGLSQHNLQKIKIDITKDLIFVFNQDNQLIQLNEVAVQVLTGSNDLAKGLSIAQKELKRKLSWLKSQVEEFNGSNQEERTYQIIIKNKLGQEKFEARFQKYFLGTVVICQKRLESPESQIVRQKQNLYQQSENTLRIKEFAIASSINAIAIVNLEGNVTYVNQAFLEMWKYDDEYEVLGNPFLNFWQIPKQAMTLIKTTHEQNQWRGELIGRSKNRSLFDAKITTNLLRNEDNIAICILVSIKDITQQKTAEESLQKLLRLYTNLTQAAPVGIFRTDKEGNCIYVNEKALLMTGITLGKALETGWAKYLHQEDKEKVITQWTLALQTQTSIKIEYRNIYPEGNLIWVLAQTIPEKDEEGEIIGYLGTLTDITERKNAEEATKEINKEMQAIFDAFPDMLFRINKKGEILDYKTQDQASLFCSPQEFIGKTIQEVLPEPVGNQLYQGVQQALLTRQIVSIEYCLTIAFKKRFFDARIVQLNQNEIIAVVRDISSAKQREAERKQAEMALRESEERLKTIIATNPNGLVILDFQGKVIFVNPAAEQLFGRKGESLMGQILGIPLIVNNHSEIEIIQPTGKIVITRIQVVKIIWEEQEAFLASLVDVTDLKGVQKQLKIFKQATEQSPVSVVITDAKGNIEYVNAKFEQITGYTRQEVIGKNPRVLKSGETSREEYKRLWQTITSGQEWHGEFHNQKKNGELFWEAASICAIKNEEGAITHFVGIKEDITQRKAQEAILAYQANHDALTGLPNRFLAIDRLKLAILQAERQKQRVGVMFVDLDHFKNVNDTLGHEYGDLLLRQVSERLKNCLRKSDTVARLGGDEFLIIVTNLEQSNYCKVIARKILSSLEKPFDLLGEEAFISASIGITLYPDDGKDVSALMRNADAAMYSGKRGGRNDFKFYALGMNETAQSRLRVEHLLHHALEKKEIYLVYQPIIELKTQKIVGAEALLRWNNPELGRVRPAQFISIAEEAGLINQLGAWVISQACQEVVKWKAQETPIPVAVNLSPRQFRDAKLIQIISEALAANEISNHWLELEITEKLLLEDFPAAKKLIHQLHKMNFRLSIDDFGTGYSALSNLIKFPFNRLKIDRSFIREMSHKQEAMGLVKTIIAMGQGLKLQVIAEGVETSEQANCLKAQGCDYAQGYFFSPPLPSEQFRHYLQLNKNPQSSINPSQ